MGKAGEIFKNVTIGSVAAEGKCVTRINDKVVFVSHAAPGDVADLKIVKKKKKFSEAVPLHFHQFSPLRTEPFCPHFGACGGCKWQHLSYEAQLDLKRRQVVDNLERIGKIEVDAVEPILGSEKTSFYRNKLEFTFSSRKWLTPDEVKSGEEINRNGLGFHMPGRFDRVLDIDECALQPEPSNSIRLETRRYALEHNLDFYDVLEHRGLLRTLVIRTSNVGETMVILQAARPEIKKICALLDRLTQKFPEISSVYYVINEKRNDVFTDQELVHYKGAAFITEKIEDLEFRIGPKSFFQTNSGQAARLYSKIREFAGIQKEDIVYDLYTGTGTIANFVARGAGKVIGLEYVPEAIEDAKMNAQVNRISNADFYAGDIKDMLDDAFVKQHGAPDVVITDPPRAGMHKDVVDKLLALEPRRIVYVSCNPATQARDAAWLAEKYRATVAQPVDMFPHTHHVENILILELNK